MVKVHARNLRKSAEFDSPASGARAGGTSAAAGAAAEPLLDLLEGKHIAMPYGCRSGSCGACRVTVHKGIEQLQPPGPIEEDTLARCGDDPSKVRLACQACLKAGAQGDIEVEPAPEVDPLDS